MPDYQDDLNIDGTIVLYRRIHCSQIYFDEDQQRYRPSSAAFADEELSVYFPHLLANLSRSVSDLLPGYAVGSGAAQISVSLARSYEQSVCYDIDLNDAMLGSAHGIVFGNKKRKTSGKKVSQWLALSAVWVIEGRPC